MSDSEASQKLGSFRWRSPYVQTCYCSVITAATAGLYVALTGLGAGGGKPSSQWVASRTNSIEDSLWAVGSLFNSVMLNVMGINYVLALGASGFPIYLAGFWIYDRTGLTWVPQFLGAVSGLLGCGLWAVQNWVSTCYPEEHRKGLYVFSNWAIIKSGAVVGSLVALGINIHRTETSVAWYLYLVFFLIMCAATVAAFFVVDPSTIRRDDGTAIAEFEKKSVAAELRGMWALVCTKEALLMLLPMFVVESHLAPHSSINSYTFTLRTRTLNNLLYWLVPIFLTPVFWFLADYKHWTRPRRALAVTTLVFVVVTAGFIGSEILVSGADYADRAEAGPSIDWADAEYGRVCVLYIVWGISYSLFFQLRLWFVGALSNAPEKLARYSSLMPAMQAAGITIAFGIDSVKPAYWKEVTVWFSLFMAAFACLYYLIFAGYITKTRYFQEEHVIVPIHVAKEMAIDGVKGAAAQLDEEQMKEAKTHTIV